VHRAVALCMDHCYNSNIVADPSWYKTVVLAGGTGCLPGLPGMFSCKTYRGALIVKQILSRNSQYYVSMCDMMA
jgi:hypothetical protein